MMLAETSTADPSASQLGIWIMCAFCVLNGIGTLILIIKLLRNDSERREVTIMPGVVSKHDFDKHVDENREDINLLHGKIGSSERETRRTATEKAEKLSEEINHVSVQVGGLSKVNELQSKQLATINQDIKDMPAQIITMLRNPNVK